MVRIAITDGVYQLIEPLLRVDEKEVVREFVKEPIEAADAERLYVTLASTDTLSVNDLVELVESARQQLGRPPDKPVILVLSEERVRALSAREGEYLLANRVATPNDVVQVLRKLKSTDASRGVALGRFFKRGGGKSEDDEDDSDAKPPTKQDKNNQTAEASKGSRVRGDNDGVDGVHSWLNEIPSTADWDTAWAVVLPLEEYGKYRPSPHHEVIIVVANGVRSAATITIDHNTVATLVSNSNEAKKIIRRYSRGRN